MAQHEVVAHRRRRRVLGALGLGAVLAAAVGVVLVVPRGPAYAPLRQTTEEGIPGTLLLELRPPPEGYRPHLSPQEAYDIAWQERPPNGVYRTLAVVTDSYYGSDASPDWVFIAKGECYPSAKGDLVSPARSGSIGETCTDADLAIVAVDANDGKPASAFLGFDASEKWVPAVAGGPAASHAA